MIDCLQNGVKVRSKYPPEVREFCLGLQFRSTTGYEFVRKIFKNNLPNLSTLRAWYSESDMNAEPGIHLKCLEILSQKSAQMKKNGKQLACTLMFDEIYIRKHVQYCHSSKKILGLVSYGNRSADPELAKQVIVFMLSGINYKFQLPIAYHFISSLTQDDRRKLLIEIINALHNAGVIVTNLTFDGHPSNIPMCKSLGANLDVFSESFQPYIVMNEKKIFILLDPCHMLKLARNTLGKKEVIIDGEGNKIKWVYFEKLVEFSSDKGLALCHKMNHKHLQWKRKIMKVDLAVQTLSQSVATCLQFLMVNGFKEFAGSAATIKYVGIFNNLFDVFNTKPNAENENQLRVPICANNKEAILCLFDRSIDYLKGLRIVEANERNVLLCKSRLRTAFIGYIINMKSLIAMYEEYIENQSLMESIPTHSLLQDHLELFFCMIRSLNGFNDNPTVQQFKAAYRKLLVNNTKIHVSKDANCNLLETDFRPFSDILTISSRRKIKESTDIDGEIPTCDELNELMITLRELDQINSSALIDNCVKDLSILHIASTIEFKIKNNGNWYCTECMNVFDQNDKVPGPCITIKLNEKPCNDTYKICKEVDRFLHLKLLAGQIKFSTIHYTIMRNIDLGSLYEGTDFKHSVNHKLYLVRAIIDCYIQIKCTYLAKFTTLNCQNQFIRSQCLSLIHYRGQ